MILKGQWNEKLSGVLVVAGKKLNRPINNDGQGTGEIKTSKKYERQLNCMNGYVPGTVDVTGAELISVTERNMGIDNGGETEKKSKDSRK